MTIRQRIACEKDYLNLLEDLILASLNPRAISGLPHPLTRFAANGKVKEGPYAGAIIEFIKDWTCEAPESVRHRAAMWFLFGKQSRGAQVSRGTEAAAKG